MVNGWLGHSDAAFTLRTYVHLMDDGWEMLTSWLPLLAAAPPKKVGDPLTF